MINISFSTITNNEAARPSGEPVMDYVGGGIAGGFPRAPGSGQINIDNTILAGNKDEPEDHRHVYAPDCFIKAPGQFTSFRGNLVGALDANCEMRDMYPGHRIVDQTGTPNTPLDPGLSPLEFNISLTQTHPLRLHPSSPAIDNGVGLFAGTFFHCPDTDQRGEPRPAGFRCDVGAFEAPQ